MSRHLLLAAALGLCSCETPAPAPPSPPENRSEDAGTTAGNAADISALAIPESVLSDNDKALFAAVEEQDADLVNRLISNGARVSARNSAGETPLIHFAAHCSPDTELDEIDWDAQSARDLERNPAWKTLKALLDHKSDVNAADNNGNTALMDAARQGHRQVARTLVQHFADRDRRNKAGKTAGDIAMDYSEFETYTGIQNAL